MFDWWTFFFQLINFFIVLFILYRLFFRPLQRVIDARESALSERTERLGADEARLKAERAEYEVQREALNLLRETELEKVRTEVLGEQERLKRQMRGEMAAALEKESAAIARERESFGREIRRQSLEFSLEYATRLLDTLCDLPLHERRTEAFLRELEGDSEVAALKAEAGGKTCTVTLYTPRPLEPPLRQKIETALSGLLGCSAVALTEIEEPALLCGIRLRIGNRIFDGSVRAALERFRDTAGQGA